MTDPYALRNRFWGSHKPARIGVQAAASTADNSAEIRLYDPIDSWGAPYGVSAKEFAAALDALPEGTQTLHLRINSPGGEAFEGIAILNMLRNHPASVVAHVDGLAASAASTIATGADRLVMGQGAQLMIHKAWGLVVGNSDDMAAFAAQLDKLNTGMAQVYQAKAGGTVDDWMAAMSAETWYTADEAVEAGLADAVASGGPSEAKARAAFDLSIFAHAGREHAPEPYMPAKSCRCGSNGTDISGDPRMEHRDECPTRTQTPAEPPETPPTEPKGADLMSDTIPKAGLCKALGLADDADEDSILDALDERLAAQQHAQPTATADDAVRNVVATLEADGKIVVSKARLDALEAQAAEGAQARAKQIADERDQLIEAAMAAGKISRSDATRETWQKEFARNFDGAKADLDSLPARFPVGEPTGYAGDDGSTGGNAQPFTDDEADAVAALAGVSKEALNG